MRRSLNNEELAAQMANRIKGRDVMRRLLVAGVSVALAMALGLGVCERG